MAVASKLKTSEGPTKSVEVRLVDCDVHPFVDQQWLAEYMPEPWRSRYFTAGDPREVEPPLFIYQAVQNVMRGDAVPPSGGYPGSDPEFVTQHLLKHDGVDYAMLFPLQPRSRINDPEFESAVLSACNSFIADVWLSKHNWHGRYRGSVRVNPSNPKAAVAEIEKWAGHPYVSQIFITPEQSLPLGNPIYHPVFEAAARQGLPIAFHINLHPGGMRYLTPVGFPSYLLEHHSAHSLRCAAHIASLVFEGVFEKYPQLRMVFVEDGFTWVPFLMWRLDNYWRALGAEVPAVKRLPSEYIKEHIRFSTQPVEDVGPFENLEKVIRWMDGERLLMFSSDYPHSDYDDPTWVRKHLPKDVRDRICSKNAIEFYGLPETRPQDALDVG